MGSRDAAVARAQAFYAWEIHGRGYEHHPHPVRLEPAWRPLRNTEATPKALDDGRRHTFFSGLLSRLSGSKRSAEPPPEPDEEGHTSKEAPDTDEIDEYQLIFKQDARIAPEAVSRFLTTLGSTGPLAFEIAGNSSRVTVGLSGAPVGIDHALSHFGSLFPEAEIAPAPQSLPDRWIASGESLFSVAELALSQEFMLPLQTFRSFTPDPLAPIIGALGNLGEDELGVFQVLFEATQAPWSQAVLQAVHTPSGKPFFIDAPDLTSYAKEKISSPLFAVAIRIAARSSREARIAGTLQQLFGALGQYADTNQLIDLEGDVAELEFDLLFRRTHRSGMLLSTDELVGLVHPPSDSVRSPALARRTQTTKGAPPEVLDTGLYLGENSHCGETAEVRLPTTSRLKHVHVLGASGTGKSTLLVQMILEDIEAGRGVGVLDPHGDLIDAVLARLPEARADDVVLIDPSDPEYVVGWNVLEAKSETERELLASDLVAVFRRLATSWGDQMTSVLSHTVLAFLDSPRGGTLSDLRHFLVDERFRKEYLGTLRDPHLRSFWEHEFPMLVGRRPQAPILTRLDTFLRSSLVRDMVTVREGLDFRGLVDSGKIILAKLSQGAIGVENAALLGSLLVAKLHQVTLSRQDQRADERRPFFLYLDEFHELVTPSMATLFSGVRKYALGLVVAHQDLAQLHARAPEVERSVLANAYTRIAFRLGESDARSLERGFSAFSADDLMSLSTGEAVVRVGRRDADFNLRTSRLPQIGEAEAEESAWHIRRRSSLRYGKKRERAEAAPVVEREEPSARPDEQQEVQPSPKPAQEAPRGDEPPEPTAPHLSKKALDYLASIATDPFLGVRERNVALGLSAWKGQKIKTSLLDEALATEVVINPGGRGQRFKLLELTGKGRSLLSEFEVVPTAGLGRGGVAHQWWVEEIATWLEAEGLTVSVEDESQGARVDLLVPLKHGSLAIEVEISEGHVLENIEKDRRAGFETIVSLIEDQGVLERIQRKLQQGPKGLVLGLLTDFREELGSLVSTRSPLRPPNQDQEPRRQRRRSAPSPASRRKSTPVTTVSLEEPGAYTTPLAAEYLGLSPATLETMRSRGGGPVFVKLGRRVVYRREDLDEWLTKNRKRSTSEL